MDDDAQWMAAGLFSPSKARQQEAQAKDWLYVDEWLRQQYAPRRAPTFERNDDTLQALMSLVAANERADEQRDLVDGLEQAALDEAKERQVDDQRDNIYQAIMVTMDPTVADSVRSLAKAAVELNTGSMQPMAIATSLIDVTNKQFALSQQLARTEALRKMVGSERANIQELLNEVTGPSFVAPPDLQEKIAEWTRGSKHLKSKLNEYSDRLAASQVTVPHPDIKTVEDKRADNQALRLRIDQLNKTLSVFRGLPLDPTDARTEVDDAKTRLLALVAQRDRMFAELV